MTEAGNGRREILFSMTGSHFSLYIVLSVLQSTYSVSVRASRTLYDAVRCDETRYLSLSVVQTIRLSAAGLIVMHVHVFII